MTKAALRRKGRATTQVPSHYPLNTSNTAVLVILINEYRKWRNRRS